MSDKVIGAPEIICLILLVVCFLLVPAYLLVELLRNWNQICNRDPKIIASRNKHDEEFYEYLDKIYWKYKKGSMA
ncbi:hypothetical protein CAEBREN_22914 [Caenorhabditis brenneri]|uniref:Uncharacterized protein n=1 Tax=Caenorhabditis brenneri TaxID=135651 RepID=G0NPB8_CAEBE|nr:hypothetical protein CAEBREN_22914 [Caenorhabditis brenneri]